MGVGEMAEFHHLMVRTLGLVRLLCCFRHPVLVSLFAICPWYLEPLLDLVTSFELVRAALWHCWSVFLRQRRAQPAPFVAFLLLLAACSPSKPVFLKSRQSRHAATRLSESVVEHILVCGKEHTGQLAPNNKSAARFCLAYI